MKKFTRRPSSAQTDGPRAVVVSAPAAIRAAVGGAVGGATRRKVVADPLVDAVLELCVDTGALAEVAGVVNLGEGGGGAADVAEVAEGLVAGAIGLVGGSVRKKGILKEWLVERGESGVLGYVAGWLEIGDKRRSSVAAPPPNRSADRGKGVGRDRLMSMDGRPGLGGDGSSDEGSLGGSFAGSSAVPGGSVSNAGPEVEETPGERVRKVAPQAQWISNEIKRIGTSLSEEELEEVSAMLACMSEKSDTTLAGITAVYTMQSRAGALPGSWAPKGEAAVVWRSGAQIEKTVRQYARVHEKVTAAVKLATDKLREGVMEDGRGGIVELVANCYEVELPHNAGAGETAKHDNARYILAVMLMLLGVTMRCGEGTSAKVWCQAMDIHAPTPSACVKMWEPSLHAAIVSIKGPWPWGDRVRSSVSSSERSALAMTLAKGGDDFMADGGDAPVIEKLEVQATEMLQQKREKHVFLIGCTGVGKSSLGNLMIGDEAFMVDATKTGTLAPQPYLTEWGLQKQVIWDTPGLSDGKNRDALFLSELTLVVDRVQLAAAVILVIRSPARIPHSLVEALQKYMALFGPQLAKVLYIVVNESSRVFPPEEIEMYNMTVAEQLSDELGLEMEPGFLLQVPTNRPDIALAEDVNSAQVYNVAWLRQAVLGSRPVLTRMGHQTIESLLALRTSLDSKQSQFYRRQLLEQSGRQREGLQLLLSRADIRKAFFSKRGYVLIQTWDLSRSSRVLQVLQGMDSRTQQRRELRITPDSAELGGEIANGLQLRKKHYTSRKEVRATTPEDVFSVLEELGLVLIPLTAPTFSDDTAAEDANAGESFAAARPGDKVSQRTLKAISEVLANSTTSDSVVRLVQSCIEDSMVVW